MPSIKISEELESFYKLKTVFIIAFIFTFILENHYIPFLENPGLTSRFLAFFEGNNANLLGLYGTLVGLLLTAYAMIVAVLPLFSVESMKRPIFSQINRLFVFTILDGILLIMLFFTIGYNPTGFNLPYSNPALVSFVLDIEIFLFMSLIFGLIFCVLTLSDLFKIIRKRGSR